MEYQLKLFIYQFDQFSGTLHILISIKLVIVGILQVKKVLPILFGSRASYAEFSWVRGLSSTVSWIRMGKHVLLNLKVTYVESKLINVRFVSKRLTFKIKFDKE